MRLFNISFWWLLPALCAADIAFTTPLEDGSSSFSANVPFTVQWKDGGALPPLSNAAGDWTLYLCTGSADNIDCNSGPITAGVTPQPLVGALTGAAAVLAKQVTILPSAGPTGKYYFWKISWGVVGSNVQAINYSARFKLSGMTGAFSSPAIQAAALAVPWAAPKASLPSVDAPAGAPLPASFAIPYPSQQGPIKYAPMQRQPGSVITAKSASRQFPTSAYTVFTVLGGAPDATTTTTAPITYSLSTAVNAASPAPNPQDAMQKWLNRWKD